MGCAPVRLARRADHWRHLSRVKRSFDLESVEIRGKPPLGDLKVELPANLAVICGLNGVGKTTLLRVLEGLGAGVDVIAARCRSELLQYGHAKLDVLSDGRIVTAELGSSTVDGLEVVVVDAFEGCSQALAMGAESNFADLLEGVEANVWDEHGCTRAGIVVGRPYESIEVKEIELPSDLDRNFGEAVVPFFTVESRGAAYSSPDMGMGELAALTALWQLDRALPQSVVIVEEPESFLSSHATVALLDVLVEAIDRKNIYGVVSTHSPDVVGRTPLEHIVVLTTDLNGATVHRRPVSRAELEHLLQSHAGQSRLVIVEDEVARIFVEEVLASTLGLWAQSIEIQEAGDADAVLRLCRDLPLFHSTKLVGVVDGDQRERAGESGDLKSPIAVLPGDRGPEWLLLDVVRQEAPRLAVSLGRSEMDVAQVLERRGGADPHDWFDVVAEDLRLEKGFLIRASVQCWLDSEEARQVANELSNAVIEGFELTR